MLQRYDSEHAMTEICSDIYRDIQRVSVTQRYELNIYRDMSDIYRD